MPKGVSRDAVGFQAGGNHSIRFDRLLIEMSTISIAGQEPIAPNGSKIALLRRLDFGQPTQSAQTPFHDVLLPRGSAATDQRLSETRIIIRDLILAPGPIIGARLLK